MSPAKYSHWQRHQLLRLCHSQYTVY